MKSASRGKRTSNSGVEVSNVSEHGFWLLIGERELFVRFQEFPWFRDVSIGKLVNVQLPSAHHLYWPDLDVDLAVESIEHPERFPLVSGVRHDTPIKAKRAAASSGKPRRPSRSARG